MIKIDEDFREALDYNDLFIVPKKSHIKTRTSVDITTKVKNKIWQVPVMPANMLSVTTDNMARAVLSAGGITALHRFQTIEEACIQFQKLYDFYNDEMMDNNVFVSVGVNRDSKDRTDSLYSSGARNFIIDIAHGHSSQMVEMIQWIKTNYKDTFVMAGNVATANAVRDLGTAGADAVKCGIGPGAACLTKNITGVTIPQASCISNCVIGKNIFNFENRGELIIVADGGVREIGDVCKALGLGADLVMAGKLFVGCKEALEPGKYSGSASALVQTIYRTDKESLPTPEGDTIIVKPTYESATKMVEHISGGIKSSCSYVGAENLEQFKRNTTFGIRYNKS